MLAIFVRRSIGLVGVAYLEVGNRAQGDGTQVDEINGTEAPTSY